MDKLLASLKSLVVALQDLLVNLYHDPLDNPATLPMNLPPANNVLNTLALAFQKTEGWILNPPSRSVRNSNPGNCRYSTEGYLSKYGHVGKDKDGFAIFKDYETGFLYLKNLIHFRAMQHPDWNLFDLANSYAPIQDHNNPVRYAESLGRYAGLNPSSFRLKSLI